MEKISRSGYFFGALLFHLVIFILVATWVIFPAFHPPPDNIPQAFLPPAPAAVPPPPPTSPQPPTVASDRAPAPSPAVIVTPGSTHTFDFPVPKLDTTTTAADAGIAKGPPVPVTPNTISPERKKKIIALLQGAGRNMDDIIHSDNDPRNIKAKFVVYLASYADGDWGCNIHMTDGKIDAGSLPNLLAKVGEWSHGNIAANVIPTPLNIASQDLLDKKPPFIFFTGHKDFVLTPQEVQNLQDYLQLGGLIWGDNALAGRGSRFDVAFRREMKRVVPDLDKKFEPVSLDDKIFTKSWWPISKLPAGMNFYAEPLEHLDIDGKLAILYTPNDYSDLFSMYILPGDNVMGPVRPDIKTNCPLFTNGTFLYNRTVFFRNFELPSSMAAERLGMNIIGYLLVRFDDDLLLSTH